MAVVREELRLVDYFSGPLISYAQGVRTARQGTAALQEPRPLRPGPECRASWPEYRGSRPRRPEWEPTLVSRQPMPAEARLEPLSNNLAQLEVIQRRCKLIRQSFKPTLPQLGNKRRQCRLTPRQLGQIRSLWALIQLLRELILPLLLHRLWQYTAKLTRCVLFPPL